MSETGHSKNIAQFSQLLSIVGALDGSYNPSNPLIAAANLQTKLTGSQTAVSAANALDSAETLAVSGRQTVFAPLGTLVTRITNAAAVSVNDELFSRSLRTVARKLQGRRATPKKTDDPATPGVDESKQSISASRMSYDSRLANFSYLITLLETNGAYNPNETELQTAALKTLLGEMQAKNTAVAVAATAARNARAARDEMLYNDTDGIIALASLVKKYVKSVFGADSPQSRQLTALKFKKP